MEIGIDFLNISKELKDSVVQAIDDEHYMELQSSSTSRLELYSYALALGKNNPTNMQKKDSFIRNEYLSKSVEAIALLVAVAYAHRKDFENLEDILDTKKIGQLSDACANTGFQIIGGDMKENYNGDNGYLKMISDLDDLYEKNIGK